MKINTHNKTYLDYASATPIDKKVLKLMSQYEKDYFANPTSIHSSGVRVREIIEKSREIIAKGINAHNDEIIFTGSSTESNALGIIGVFNNYQLLTTDGKKIPHIITTEIEHPAVLMNCRLLEERGIAEITYIKVNEKGIVNPKDIKDAIKSNTILVSVMYANNEVGTVQPIQEIAKAIRHYKKDTFDISGKSTTSPSIYPVFHTDATQAMNYLDTSNIEKLGVDMLSFNGSKIYGPKSIGVLYKKRSVILSPIYGGGNQELGLRSGTESVALIAGLALAFEITNKIKNKEVVRLTKLRDYLIEKIFEIKVPPFKIVLNGDPKERLPNNINISIGGISSELLVVELDAKGIEVSSRSACKSGEDNDSYVIKAIRMAIDEKLKEEEGSLRITLGRLTNKPELNKFIAVLTKILDKYKKWK
jgi:cysteine desulfurase